MKERGAAQRQFDFVDNKQAPEEQAGKHPSSEAAPASRGRPATGVPSSFVGSRAAKSGQDRDTRAAEPLGTNDELWARYYAPITYFVRSSLSYAPESDIEDAVQEIMLKAFEHRKTYDDRWAFSTWLYTIAGNACRDYRRRRDSAAKGMTLLKGMAHSARQSEPSDPVATEVLKADLRARVTTFLARLSATDHRILFLHYFEEMPFAGIASALGMPEGTAKYRAHVLRRRLKDYMEAPDADERQ